MGFWQNLRNGVSYATADEDAILDFQEQERQYEKRKKAARESSARANDRWPDSDIPLVPIGSDGIGTKAGLEAARKRCRQLGILPTEEPHKSIERAINDKSNVRVHAVRVQEAGQKMLDSGMLGGTTTPDSNRAAGGIAGNRTDRNMEAIANPEIAAARPAAAAAAGGKPAVRSPASTRATPTKSSVKTTYGQQQRFKQQCYLLSRIKNFASFSSTLHAGYTVDKKDYSRKLPYADGVSNTHIPVVGEPFGLINKLIGNTNLHALNDLTPTQISALVPLVRIFKASKLSDGSEMHKEIIFDTHVTRNDMTIFESRAARGGGSGLVSFGYNL